MFFISKLQFFHEKLHTVGTKFLSFTKMKFLNTDFPSPMRPLTLNAPELYLLFELLRCTRIGGDQCVPTEEVNLNSVVLSTMKGQMYNVQTSEYYRERMAIPNGGKGRHTH